jgi:hypothetical protein
MQSSFRQRVSSYAAAGPTVLEGDDEEDEGALPQPSPRTPRSTLGVSVDDSVIDELRHQRDQLLGVRGGAVSYSEEQQQQASAMHHRPYTQQHTPHEQYWQQQLQASADSLAQQQGGPAEGLVQGLPPPPASGAR